MLQLTSLVNSRITRRNVNRVEGRDQDRHTVRPKRDRLFSYLYSPSTDGAQEDLEFGRDGNERNLSIGDAAVSKVLRYEQDHGRSPEDQPHWNEGYDVESRDPESGQLLRHIEVKGTDGSWDRRGIPLSPAQFRFGLQNEETFWLYVVEHARDPEHAKVWPLRNPLSRVTQFRLDEGWKKFLEEN